MYNVFLHHALFFCSGKTRQGWRSEEHSSGGRCTDTLPPLGDKLQGDNICHQLLQIRNPLMWIRIRLFTLLCFPDTTPHQSDANRFHPWLDFEPQHLFCECPRPSMAPFEPWKHPNLDKDANPDPAFHLNSDPDPAFCIIGNRWKPDPHHCCWIVIIGTVRYVVGVPVLLRLLFIKYWSLLSNRIQPKS